MATRKPAAPATPAPAAAAPKSPTASAKDLLKNLTGTKKAPAASKAPSNPEFPVPADLQETFQRYIVAEAIGDAISDRVDNAAEELKAGFLKFWVGQLWATKSRPGNPRFYVTRDGGSRDAAAVFQVQDAFSFNLGDVPEGSEAAKIDLLKVALVAALEATGLAGRKAEELAGRLIELEIENVDKKSIDLNRLVDGYWQGVGKNRQKVEASEQDQALALKVISLLTLNPDDLAGLNPKDFKEQVLPLLLAPAEVGQVITVAEGIGVKKGFLNRVAGLVSSEAELRAVLSVIKPKVALGTQEFGLGQDDNVKQARKLEAVSEMFQPLAVA